MKVRHAGEGRHPGSFSYKIQTNAWIPACAGMTEEGVDVESTASETRRL